MEKRRPERAGGRPGAFPPLQYREALENPPLLIVSDLAVFAAYGWPDDLTDEEILERLLALNLERAGGQ